MSPVFVGVVAISVLILLIFLRIPVGVALLVSGFIGNFYFMGMQPAVTQFQLVVWELGSNFVLIALPLFVLMGQLAHQFHLGRDMYQCFNKWIGHFPGGLAATSIVSSASFGSVTGSSLATVAAIGKTLLPEMKQSELDQGYSAGTLASAGVLAILIPPSVPLVFYSAWTETSLGDLFLAGLVPGLLLMLLFLIYVTAHGYLKKAGVSLESNYSWAEKIHALWSLLPILMVLFTVLGSIYLGVATPTEAASIGVTGIVLLVLFKRRFSLSSLKKSLEQSIYLTSNIVLLLLGGMLFSRFLVQTDLTNELILWVSSLNASPEIVLLILVFIYLLLGAILDTFGMIILTLPFVFPLVQAIGVDPVWFGIFIVMMIELALITPPIGMNVFVIHRLDPSVPITKIYKGTFPFVVISLIFVLVLILCPDIALWFPRLLNS
ncbi:MAG: TRAP transporter large permease [Pseudomonadales bacterium]|nr:TRAP transporter large permease [Pseudomonadales bacterium]